MYNDMAISHFGGSETELSHKARNAVNANS